MRNRRIARIAALTALPAALALSAAAPALAADSQAYQIDLKQLNDSGASGTAMVSLEDTKLTVKIQAEGLTPGAPHAQHIHGSTKGMDFHCPDASADKDGDGIVSTVEGLPAYGDINISLTTSGDTSKDSGLAVDRMPTAGKDGKLSYERTITVSQDVADHFKDLHIVQHGIDVNDNGTYDMDAGKSQLDPKLPLEATAPASCGMVHGASIGEMPEGGVETGTAATGGDDAGQMMALGGAGLMAAAVGAVVVWRRAGER
ncbi:MULTISPECIES: CHRD domain-containing protein [unclassified Streptomyces]|uniref:CHRD domain-containing protein n=1 Tax=unclassified Streptomyces TaxID=2593676 RepID=UPI002877C5BC|nr:CHRD domain-containing protein [Streptomyces sp. BB1-1-1]WND33166.1 CHRD domain-containing protein [Streptomyces sp. BB1-1-1]